MNPAEASRDRLVQISAAPFRGGFHAALPASHPRRARRRHRARLGARLLRLGGAALPGLLPAGRRRRPSVLALPKTESFESGPFAGLVHVDWHAVDAWFEEDEEVFGGHPRSPYARVDAIRSSRHIRVEIEGVVLAETTAPVLLFETGLPTRHYIQRTDVDFAALERTDTDHLLPLQGDDQRLLVGADRRRAARRHRLVLRLPVGPGAADRRADRLLRREGRHLLDGVPVARPRTKFSPPRRGGRRRDRPQPTPATNAGSRWRSSASPSSSSSSTPRSSTSRCRRSRKRSTSPRTACPGC